MLACIDVTSIVTSRSSGGINAGEFIDKFCCVIDVAWNKLLQALENGSMKLEMFSVNVPIPETIGLPVGIILSSFAKVIMSFMS